MKKNFILAVVLCGLSGALCQAQQPTLSAREPEREAPVGKSAHQPRHAQTWVGKYGEETPQDYIRRRAQEKAEARRARIEGYRAMGYSPLRPTISSTPFMSRPPMWSVSHVGSYPLGNGFWYLPVP